MNTNKDDIYLISDSNLIKKFIVSKFNRIKTDYNEIIHLSLREKTKNLNNIKYTLHDLYLLLYCKKLFSFTIYQHGSGFVKWIATLYNKPYIQHTININKPNMIYM